MLRHQPKTRLAFTLVELLVVIAIISTLMGLLLPAVQNAREASRRNTCSNNLSNIAKATISYDGNKGYLPGWKNNFPTPVTTTYMTWPVVLLPNLERSDVYRAVESGSTTALASAPSLPILQCPSAPADGNTNGSMAYAGNVGSCINLMSSTTSQAKADGVLCDRAALSSRGLGHWPFTPVTRVRIPSGSFARTITPHAVATLAFWLGLVLPPFFGPLFFQSQR